MQDQFLRRYSVSNVYFHSLARVSTNFIYITDMTWHKRSLHSLQHSIKILINKLKSTSVSLWDVSMNALLLAFSRIFVISCWGSNPVVVNTRRQILSVMKGTLFCCKYFVHRANIGMCRGKYRYAHLLKAQVQQFDI